MAYWCDDRALLIQQRALDDMQLDATRARSAKPDLSAALPTPIGESVLVWAGACALAERRHPTDRRPQPADVEDARTVLLAAASIDRNTSPTHG